MILGEVGNDRFPKRPIRNRAAEREGDAMRLMRIAALLMSLVAATVVTANCGSPEPLPPDVAAFVNWAADFGHNPRRFAEHLVSPFPRPSSVFRRL